LISALQFSNIECEFSDNEAPLPEDFDSVFETNSNPVAAIRPAEEQNSLLDVMDLVAMAPPAEYSYFIPDTLAVHEGPAHWRKLRSRRTTVPSLKDKGIFFFLTRF